MANIGLPGTAGFVGEFLSLAGSFKMNPNLTALAALGMILSAVYGLWLYRKVVVGALENDLVKGLKDMNAREIMALLPLAFLTLLLGFYPSLVLDLSDVAVTQMLEPVQSHLVEANNIVEVVVREGGYNK